MASGYHNCIDTENRLIESCSLNWGEVLSAEPIDGSKGLNSLTKGFKFSLIVQYRLSEERARMTGWRGYLPGQGPVQVVIVLGRLAIIIVIAPFQLNLKYNINFAQIGQELNK